MTTERVTYVGAGSGKDAIVFRASNGTSCAIYGVGDSFVNSKCVFLPGTEPISLSELRQHALDNSPIVRGEWQLTYYRPYVMAGTGDSKIPSNDEALKLTKVSVCGIPCFILIVHDASSADLNSPVLCLRL